MLNKYVVEGVEISPAEATDSSWRIIHGSCARTPSTGKKSVSVQSAMKQTASQVPRRSTPRPPPLPAGDYKIVIRLRGGLDCSKIPAHALRQAVLQASKIPAAQASTDQFRPNHVNNTLLVSTPSMDHTEAYHKIKALTLNDTTYEVVTHVADPRNSCKGVIHGIPLDHTAEDITSSLLDFDRHDLIVMGRRMGSTQSVLVTFRGTRVPYYILYQGCVTRCVPYRLKVEACNLCRKIGHRPDVCPGTTVSLCPRCGVTDPAMDHDCEPSCVICKGNHPTGSPQCKLRFRARPAQSTPDSDPSSSVRDPAFRARSTTRDRGSNSNRGRSPSQRRGRSSSKRRGANSKPITTTAPETQVSWAGVVSHDSSVQNQLKTLQNEIALLRAENTKLRLELQSLKQPPPHCPPSTASFATPLPGASPPVASTPPPDRDPVLPPAQKRKNPASSHPDCSWEDRLAALENKLGKFIDEISPFLASVKSFMESAQQNFLQLNTWTTTVNANHPHLAQSPPPPTASSDGSEP